jgi:mono/diheme cytochrome c family protein
MNIKYFWWGMVAVMSLGILVAKTWAWQGSDLEASIARGKTIYNTQCVTCHREKGEGIKDVYPPLAKSDYLMANKPRSISIVVNGASGEMTVNGAKYDGDMLSVDLPDEQVSDVLNYVRNSWGNEGEAVKPEEVAPQKKK